MRIKMLAALVLFAGCAADARDLAPNSREQADAAKLAKALEGLTPGKPQSCLTSIRQNYHTETIGDTILYRVNDRLLYRTEAPGCRGAARGDVLVSVNYSSQLCRGQIVQTVDLFSRFQTGSCSLSAFTPYTKAK